MENGVGPGKSLNLPNNAEDLLLDQPLHWLLWHQWFSGQNGGVVFVAPVFHRPQLFNGLCAPVVFGGRSNSLAPVAQVVLWFPAPVVSGRGNSLVLWLRGFPWFPGAHWFLWSDCGAVQWLKCAVCGPVAPWIFQPPPTL